MTALDDIVTSLDRFFAVRDLTQDPALILPSRKPVRRGSYRRTRLCGLGGARQIDLSATFAGKTILDTRPIGLAMYSEDQYAPDEKA
jgi:hypothetical protein